MRIAILLTSLGVGGAEHQAIQLGESLTDRGHLVHIFSLLGPQREQWQPSLPVTYLHLKPGLWSIPLTWIGAASSLRNFEPDVVHAHCFHGNLFARLLRPALRRAYIVSTVHNVYEGGRRRMLLYRITGRLSDRTAFVCQAGADRYNKLRAVPANRIEVVPNAIDPLEYKPLRPRRICTRTKLGARNDFVWLAVGRLAPAKDYPNLLRAFSLVHSTLSETQLWIAGQGTPRAQAELQALARKLRIEDGVRWLGLRRDIAALLDAADAFVLSSAWEGMPLSLAEAMAMEKPAVATAVGGVPQLAGPCGRLVPPGEPSQLAGAMLELMRMLPLQFEGLGTASRKRIVQYFSLDVAAIRWETLYRSLRQTRSTRSKLIP